MDLVPNAVKRVFAVSTLLIFLSAAVVIILGNAVSEINNEIKVLNDFLVHAENVQPNFESSLVMYTEDTQDLIDFVLSMRPSNEGKYIQFISEVERIGQNLSLNINLSSIEEESTNTVEPEESTLDYSITFFGSKTNLVDFLTELERLPYFIKINEIDFRNLEFLGSNNTTPNIRLNLSLYVQ